jgi:hypothetical protein
MKVCRVLEHFVSVDDMDVYILRLPQRTETSEQMIPVVENFGNPDSPRYWVVASFAEEVSLIGEVPVLSWEPVIWNKWKAVLGPNDETKTVVIIGELPGD